MSMRYTGKSWDRVRKASGETLLDCIRQAKYNEQQSKIRKRKLDNDAWAKLLDAMAPRKATEKLKSIMKERL